MGAAVGSLQAFCVTGQQRVGFYRGRVVAGEERIFRLHGETSRVETSTRGRE